MNSLFLPFAFTLSWLFCASMISSDALAQTGEATNTKPANEEVLAAATPFIVAGYIPDYQLAHWSGDVGSLTDLIYFGASVSEEGRFVPAPLSREHAQLLQKAKGETRRRLLFTVGGWNKSDGFATLAADSRLRAQFIDEAKAYCQKHGFDGIDYDWEHPKGKQQVDAYTQLLKETYDAFKHHKLIVTVAIAGWQDLGKDAFAAVDRVHLMSYDHEFPHATMDKAKADITRLLKAGCPASKIVLGIPFYGRNKDGHTKSFAQLTKGRILAHNEDIVDGYAMNGPVTVAEKVRFARETKLAGVMIWELGQDASMESSLLRSVEAEANAGR